MYQLTFTYYYGSDTMSMSSCGWNYKSFASETISITLNQVKEVGVVRTSAPWLTGVWTYQKEQRWVRTNNDAEGAGDRRCFVPQEMKTFLKLERWHVMAQAYHVTSGQKNTPG